MRTLDMSWVKRIHHVELLSSRLGQVSDYLCNRLGFRLLAVLKDGKTYRAAVKNGDAVFVLKNSNYIHLENSSSTYTSYLCSMIKPEIDTVFNIALEVENVKHSVNTVMGNGGYLLLQPTVLNDYHGKVEMAIVKSCVGNVVHTLLDTSKYRGLFLPGYTSYKPCIAYKNRHGFQDFLEKSGLPFNHDSPGIQHVTHFDHVTFACKENQSDEILRWYENSFGMKRCAVNYNEDQKEGFVVKHGLSGIKLKAFDYWKCAETGVQPQNGAFKFVIAEPISSTAPNQISTFLDQHGGPGIQHIGLHVKDICMASTQMRERGVNFMVPPAQYYTEIGKLQEIQNLGLDQMVLKENGILLDTEEDAVCPWNPDKKGFLLQVFTNPIFQRDTFFLELIERCGAKGFGAGNITALWRAVDAYMQSSKKQ